MNVSFKGATASHGKAMMGSSALQSFESDSGDQERNQIDADTAADVGMKRNKNINVQSNLQED